MKLFICRNWFLVALFLVAIVLRVGAIYFLYSLDPKSDGAGVFSSDSPTYFDTARNLILHGVFSMAHNESSPAPDNYRTPGYIAFLYPFVALRVSPIVISFAQILIASFAVAIFYLLARKVFSENVARWAAVLFAVEPFTVRMSALLTATGLFSSFFALVPLMFFIYIKQRDKKYLYGAAVLLAWCALMKPVAYIFPPFLVLAAFWGRGDIKDFFRSSVIVLAIFYVLVSPWLIRNKVVLGTWQFSSVTDYVIYDVNAQLFKDFYRLDEPLNTTGLINVGYSNAYLSQENLKTLRASGVSYILKHPVDYALFHLAFIPRLFIQDQYLDMLQKEGGTALPLNLDVYSDVLRLRFLKVFRDMGQFLSNPVFWVYIGGKIVWVTLSLLMVAAAWVAYKTAEGGRRKVLIFLLAFLLYYGAAISPVTRAGHRVAVNLLVFLAAIISVSYFRHKPIFKNEA